MICSSCGEDRTIQEMGRRPNGIDPRCKQCKAKYERARLARKRGVTDLSPHVYRPKSRLTDAEVASKVAAVPESFGHWLAGFFDGEGCFLILVSSHGAPNCRAAITLRADDEQILQEIAGTISVGKVSLQKASNGSPVATWSIHSRDDARVLAAIFKRFPLRAKKARDLQTWSSAVAVWSTGNTYDGSHAQRSAMNADRWAQMLTLREQLMSERKSV